MQRATRSRTRIHSGFDEARKEFGPFCVAKFKFGRKDCSTSPLPDWDLTTVQFPDEKLGVDEILRAFGPKSLFNFSQKDCVALIAGGHSIGRGHLNASGYEGVWDDSPDTIDNLFVKEMVEESFTQIQNPAGKWQFYNDDNVPRSEDPTLFFNTDMSLVRRLERSEESIQNGMGKVTDNCNKIDNSAADKTSKCPFSRLFSQTKYYADSDTKVLVRDFTRVYNKMLTTVTDDSVLTEVDDFKEKMGKFLEKYAFWAYFRKFF